MREGLRDNLEFEGYAVDEAADGEAALAMMTAGDYRLVVLDVMMPKRSGFEVIRAARAAGVATPVILLTAKAEEFDTVRGLEFGADDYVTKPFALGELLARVKAVLRRAEGGGGRGGRRGRGGAGRRRGRPPPRRPRELPGDRRRRAGADDAP